MFIYGIEWLGGLVLLVVLVIALDCLFVAVQWISRHVGDWFVRHFRRK